MGLLPFKCGIDGCKKSKMQRHTHTSGDLRNFGDQRLIQQYIEFARMRGEPVSIPGGEASDMSAFMRDRLKAGEKEAREMKKRAEAEHKEALKKIETEMKNQKARGEKVDRRKAEQTVLRGKPQKKSWWS